MKKASVTEELKKAEGQGYALGAFNIFNYLSARAVIAAAEEMDKPVILQTSVGTVKYYGARALHSMLAGLMDEAKVPVYLHLDHCTSLEFAKECVDAGWDSIMIDASQHALEENIRITREAADYAHRHKVQAEGELGVIAGVEEEIQSETGELAVYEDCAHFAQMSHIDFFAPAIGTAHGVYKGIPKINYDLVKELKKGISQPIVCHGGSGLSDETFTRLISCGVSKVNISTALKHASIDGAKSYMEDHPGEYNPLKMEEYMFRNLKETARRHIHIFACGK